jgi:hypothetical protein
VGVVPAAPQATGHFESGAQRPLECGLANTGSRRRPTIAEDSATLTLANGGEYEYKDSGGLLFLGLCVFAKAPCLPR